MHITHIYLDTFPACSIMCLYVFTYIHNDCIFFIAFIYIYMYIYIVSNYSSMALQLGSLALSNQSFQPDVLHEFHTENGQKRSNPRW